MEVSIFWIFLVKLKLKMWKSYLTYVVWRTFVEFLKLWIFLVKLKLRMRKQYWTIFFNFYRQIEIENLEIAYNLRYLTSFVYNKQTLIWRNFFTEKISKFRNPNFGFEYSMYLNNFISWKFFTDFDDIFRCSKKG